MRKLIGRALLWFIRAVPGAVVDVNGARKTADRAGARIRHVIDARGVRP